MNSQLKTHLAINEIQLPDGTIAQDDVQKAEAFNQFFTSIFTKKLLPTCQACILTMLLIPLVYLIPPLN